MGRNQRRPDAPAGPGHDSYHGKDLATNDAVAYNQATTTLSTITALDESPLLEGLIYVGTDDGLVQITEDGGATWHKVEKFPGVAEYAYVTDVVASPRDANTVFATFNNYQRGDFAPYIVKSSDRGRSWVSIAGNLPQRSGVWSLVQDHANGDLLFAGLEFGVWVTGDGGKIWTQLSGGIPTTQARDLQIQRRENDLIVGTFGRGVFILDDYSALRSVSLQHLTDDVRLYPLRDAYTFDILAQQQAAWGNDTNPNPPHGAVFTYSLGHPPSDGTKAVLTITDQSGREVRRLELPSGIGVSRVAWDLRPQSSVKKDTTQQSDGTGQGGRGAGGEAQEAVPGSGGRGGPPPPPPVPIGRYRAAIGLGGRRQVHACR